MSNSLKLDLGPLDCWFTLNLIPTALVDGCFTLNLISTALGDGCITFNSISTALVDCWFREIWSRPSWLMAGLYLSAGSLKLDLNDLGGWLVDTKLDFGSLVHT